MNPVNASLLVLALLIAGRPIMSFVRMVKHRAGQGQQAPQLTLN